MSRRQKAFLKEENLLTLLTQNNFIIPEIQREYVWGKNEKVITKFLKELRFKIGNGCACCHIPSSNVRINIGFLYSYKPNYVKVNNDRFLDENLIDGQQRFTTLFLLLFYFALKENRKEEFLNLIRFDGLECSFDFKVRDVTKRFLSDLLKNINNLEMLSSIEDMSWFLKDYESDLSVQAMIQSLTHIRNIYNGETKYYNHFLNNIVFWHFKTEVTSEGEELYITMNARGEELAENEITKAAMMLNGIDIFNSGKKWEEWQHLFWEHRNRKNVIQSADFGFNSYLGCIAGLENYLTTLGNEYSASEINELLDLNKIKSYINYFQRLLEVKEYIHEYYDYTDWLDRFINEVWDILNNKVTDWLVDYNDQNKGTEQNRMILFWSWLLYFREIEGTSKEFDKIETIRFLRFFWVRYKNNNRAVKSLNQTVNLATVNGVFDTLNLEVSNFEDYPESSEKESYRTTNENLKYSYLSKNSFKSDVEIKKIEECIWEIEDHPLNIIGADLKNLNSSHLIEFKEDPSRDDLKIIRDKFYDLFPLKQDGNIDYKYANKLRNILFDYGSYWQKKWASYYSKYDFGEWKRIVRDLDSNTSVFQSFFEEFIESESLDIMVDKNVKAIEVSFDTKEEINVFKWYSSKLSESMWKQGRYIAIGHYNHPKQDANFPNFKELVNIKGNFNGGTPQVLAELVK